MKTKKILTLLAAVLTIAAICLIISCSKANNLMTDENLSNGSAISEDELYSYITAEELPDCNFKIVSSADLTDVEVEMLEFLREEEKMARDVYLVLSGIYKKRIFLTIAESEQIHMDKVLCLMDHYKVEDPASSEIGEFTNTYIQGLYDMLIELGTKGIIDGLTAGAYIEDYDIHDIHYWMDFTDNESILNVLSNIVCGSGNHIISFTELLNGFDTEYTPTHITQEEYQAILDAGSQFCGM